MSSDTVYLSWTRMRPSRLNRLVRGDVSPKAPDIKELAASIRDHGVMQNVTVVELFPPADGADYEVMIGERRWQACRLLDGAAPLIPCTIIPRPATDLDALLLMGAENMQRKDLSPIEEARYFQALIGMLSGKEKARPTATLAQRLRKRRGYIENRLALLALAPKLRDDLERGAITLGAAKYLAELDMEDQVVVAAEGRGLRTRRVKELVEAKKRARKHGGGGLCRGRPPAGEMVVPYQPLAAVPGVELSVLNLALRATCGACIVGGFSEPTTTILWDEMKGAFAQACTACAAQDMKEACLDCPLIQFLMALDVLLLERGTDNTLKDQAPDHLYRNGILERRAGTNGGDQSHPAVVGEKTPATPASLPVVK